MSADEQERAGYRKYAAPHKQWRDVIHHGAVAAGYAGHYYPAHGVVSEDKGRRCFW